MYFAILFSTLVACKDGDKGDENEKGDADGDGSVASEDCDDKNADAYPGAPETCDGIDNDCEGLTDSKDDDVTGETTWYADQDGDDYGDEARAETACGAPDGYVDNGDDCDDTNPSVNPGLVL